MNLMKNFLLKKKRLTALALFLWVSAITAFAQGQVNVNGKVVDEYNEPIIGCKCA